METNNHGREDRPSHTNADEVHFTHPAKEIKAQDKIDIKESGLGREQGQTPADEHIENSISQIDDETKEINVLGIQNPNEHHAAQNDNAGYLNDETSADRDTGNSNSGNWEESRTARHK